MPTEPDFTISIYGPDAALLLRRMSDGWRHIETNVTIAAASERIRSLAPMGARVRVRRVDADCNWQVEEITL